MAVIKYNENDVKLLARLMRAEAEGEGNLGMLMVGNVGANRVRCNCLDFVVIETIEQMIFQRPGGFEAVQKGYFYQRARRDLLYLRNMGSCYKIISSKNTQRSPFDTKSDTMVIQNSKP
jgi:N-acetylmuramoyl-L-alanine amidase